MKKQQISWMQNLRKMIGYGEKKNIINVATLKAGGFNKGNLDILFSEGPSKKKGKDYIKLDMVGVKNGPHHGKKISVTFRDGYVRQISKYYKMYGHRVHFKNNGFKKKAFSEGDYVSKYSIDEFMKILSIWKKWENWSIKNLRTNIKHPCLKDIK